MLGTIVMVFAFVLFVLAAANVNHPRVSRGRLGLVFWVLAILLSSVHVGLK